MATGGCKVNASEECFGNICFPCNKSGSNIEAVKFCDDCQEYLCVTCVGDHNKWASFARHNLLGRSQFGTSGTDAGDLTSVPTERCKVHSMKFVDMYCVDHDSVGCHVCFTTNHRQCQDIHYIPEYIQTTPHAEHVQRVNDEMKNAISSLEVLMKEKQKAKDDNTRNKDTCLKEIKAFRAEINQTLDRLEKASIAEVDKKYKKLDNALKEEMKHIQETLDKLTKGESEIESSKENASQQFVSTKIYEKVIVETENYKAYLDEVHGDNLSFARESEILSTLQNHVTLGNLQGPRKRSLYEVKDKETFNVKLKNDRGDCGIWSSCILDSGDILLADSDNNKIKLVECKSYTVRYLMEVMYRPTSVCRVSATEAAVSVFLGDETIQFVSTKNQLVPTRSLTFEHTCRGITVLGGELILCQDGKRVYIYTMNGTRLKTIENDIYGHAIFGHIRQVSVSDSENMIIVADEYKGPLTLDEDGNIIWRYSGIGLKGTWGVCVDGCGNAFVSCEDSSTIEQIGSDGLNMGEVIPASYGLKCPRAVCFNRKNSKLIVLDGNDLHVFHVE